MRGKYLPVWSQDQEPVVSFVSTFLQLNRSLEQDLDVFAQRLTNQNTVLGQLTNEKTVLETLTNQKTVLMIVYQW